MLYLTFCTKAGQNNNSRNDIQCHGCGKLRSPVILIQSKDILPLRSIILCLSCLDAVNQVVNWNLKLSNTIGVHDGL